MTKRPRPHFLCRRRSFLFLEPLVSSHLLFNKNKLFVGWLVHYPIRSFVRCIVSNSRMVPTRRMTMARRITICPIQWRWLLWCSLATHSVSVLIRHTIRRVRHYIVLCVVRWTYHASLLVVHRTTVLPRTLTQWMRVHLVLGLVPLPNGEQFARLLAKASNFLLKI